MAGRESRIRHPASAKFLITHFWAIQEVGHAAAVALAIIEFRDRVRDEPGEWLANCGPKDLAHFTQGLFARDKMRAGLATLVARGWVERFEKTELVGQLWRRKVFYRLRADAINSWIDENITKTEICDFSSSGSSENRPPEDGKSSGRERKNADNPNKGVVCKRKDNNESAVVVGLPDGTEILCRPEWATDLLAEIGAAPNIRGSHMAYAAGILAKWEAAGSPSTRRAKTEAAAAAKAKVEKNYAARKAAGDQAAASADGCAPPPDSPNGKILAKAKAAAKKRHGS